MNIFALSMNYQECAKWHLDKHVVKMPLEHAQMMCTTHHLFPNKDVEYEIPYKQTHVNHPCNKWLRSSVGNYVWLWNLTKELNKEYKYRYNKDVDHKSWLAVKDLPIPNIPYGKLTPFARAMPDEVKINNCNDKFQNSIDSYQNYYRTNKQHIMQYTKRNKPKFLKVKTSKGF